MQVPPPEFKHTNLANATLFNPPGSLAPSIRVFCDVVLKDLEGIKVSKVRMQKDLENGLESLCSNKSLIIRPADKGEGIVILDRSDHLKEMHRIVEDTETYTLLNRDPIVRYKRDLEAIVDQGLHSGILNDKERLFLVPCAPRTIMCDLLCSKDT